MNAFTGKRPLDRTILRIIREFRVEKTATGGAYECFPGEKTRADVVAMLDVAAPVIYGDTVTYGVEYRLEFAGLGAKPEIGGFQFTDLLFDFGVKTDFGAFHAQEPVKT
jgi:hypothetical protein